MNFKQLIRIFGSVHCKDKICTINAFNCPKQICHRLYSVEAAAAPDKIEKADRAALLKDYINPLRKPDFFQVNNLFTIKDLVDARVHLGHKEDTLHENMQQYVFGSRLGHLIFDLPKTAEHLRKALNFTAHIAYRGGVILFVSQYHQHCPIIERTALECKEFAFTRVPRIGLFTNATVLFKTTIRLPDLLIFTSTLNTILSTHMLLLEGAKLNIPTIGIVDTNSDPTIVTYPVPGNDDSPVAIELYCKLFKTAILKGKEVRQKELEHYRLSNE